jgi:adenylate cyclase
MDVVEIDADPLAERARRRRTLLRIGMPLGGVGLIIGFLLGIAVYADSANRAGVLGLSDTLLSSLRARIALQVSAYLEPASHAILLAQSMLGRGGATARAEEAQVFAASILIGTPQIANVLFADAAGNFMLVRRAAEGPPGGTETKRIEITAAGRTVEWITRDATGAIVARRQEPNDDYDARKRGWFTGARASDDVFWSGVYIFFSERAPGITAAVRGPAPNPDIVGVDIRLDAISRFLGGLAIGRTGRAYIVAKSGEMIAGPDPTRILRLHDGKLSPARIDEVGDANLAASWDHYRVNGPGTRVIEAGGQRLISIVTPLLNDTQARDGQTRDGQDWQLLITVPEEEFSGFVTANSRQAALLTLIVVALAAGLAVLLVRQGLRADRADRAVAERSEAVRMQSAAFARMATETGMFDAAGTPPAALTETLAEATGARRASIWRLLDGGQVLRCEDSFEPATGGHVAGLELSRQEVPALIDALARGEEIDASDARHDRRTAALHITLMAPLGTVGLFAVPVMRAGPGPAERTAAGVVVLEDARRDPAARDITRACATLVALRTPALAPSGVALPAVPLEPAMAADSGVEPEIADAAGPSVDDGRGLDAALIAYGVAGAGFAAQAHARVAILVLRLPEAVIAQAAPADLGAPAASLAHRIACAAQDIAAANDIPYMKMLGASIVAAAGYDGGDAASAEAIVRLADTAIALREHCAELFDGIEGPSEFGLGLDAGLALSGMLGAAPGLFNLWGEAMRGAEALAGSAPDGVIQASDQAYLMLRQDFLFRPRGRFHRPHIGEARSYVLAGRA